MERLPRQPVAARVEGGKRHALCNARLNTHENGETTTRMLTSAARNPRGADQRRSASSCRTTDRLDPALEKALRPGAND